MGDEIAEGRSLESVYPGLSKKARCVLDMVAKIAPHARGDHITLNASQFEAITSSVEHVRKESRIDRPVRLEYAGKRLVATRAPDYNRKETT